MVSNIAKIKLSDKYEKYLIIRPRELFKIYVIKYFLALKLPDLRLQGVCSLFVNIRIDVHLKLQETNGIF